MTKEAKAPPSLPSLPSSSSIIVADDDKSVRLVIAQALKKQGYIVHTAATAAGMWDLSMARRSALLITDIGFPDGDALDMLPRLQERVPELKVIVMSARTTMLTAVQTRQQGVVDYLPKPFELKQLLETTRRALHSVVRPQRAGSVGHTSSAPLETPQAVYAPLLGRSSIMQDVYKTLAWLSTKIVPVYIESEPGSGKADVARALHDMAGYQDAPYIAMNCAQIAQNEHVSYLFDEDGVLSKVQGGTLFLNNIEKLDNAAQLLFLRFLEDQPESGLVKPRRVLIGCETDLRVHVENDEFREDLFFALSVAPVKLPPLRERVQDIPAMAHHFCEQANQSYKTSHSLSLTAITALQDYDWPGNIRELEFVVRRLVMAGAAPEIDAIQVYQELGYKSKAMPQEMPSSLTEAADIHIQNYFAALGDNMPHSGLYERIIEEVERPLIIRTLHLTKGNQIKAAQILGLNRNTLRKKIDLLTISKDRSDYKDNS